MGHGKGWSTLEDVILCRTWLNVSFNNENEYENDLNGWKTIYDEMVQKEKFKRSSRSVRSRFRRIRDDCLKFSDIFYKLQDEMREGESIAEQELLQESHQIFREVYKKKFVFEACWKIIKDALGRNPHDPEEQLIESSAGDEQQNGAEPSQKRRRTQNPNSTAAPNLSGAPVPQIIASDMSSTIVNLSNMRSVRAITTALDSFSDSIEEYNGILLFSRPDCNHVEAREYFDLLRKKHMHKLKKRMREEDDN